MEKETAAVIYTENEIQQEENEQEMDESDNLDFEYTSNEDVERIRIYEGTTEMIGWVDSMDAEKQVGTRGNTLFKFFINNNSGHRIQVITWNEEIKRIKDHVKLNHITDIDGAMPVPSKEGYQYGTLPFELTVRSNTIISNLGKHEIEHNINEKIIPIVSLKDSIDTTGLIKIRGYIKSNFLWVKKYKENMEEYGVGSVTDGVFKLEVRLTNLAEYHDFEKGEQVEIVGHIRNNSQPMFLAVASLDDVKKIKGPRMPFIKLLKGTGVPSRKRTATTYPTTSDTQIDKYEKKSKKYT